MPTAHSYSFWGFGTFSKKIYLISSYLCSQGPFFCQLVSKGGGKGRFTFPENKSVISLMFHSSGLMGLMDAHSLPSGHFLRKYTHRRFRSRWSGSDDRMASKAIMPEKNWSHKRAFSSYFQQSEYFKKLLTLYLHTSRLSAFVCGKSLILSYQKS